RRQLRVRDRVHVRGAQHQRREIAEVGPLAAERDEDDPPRLEQYGPRYAIAGERARLDRCRGDAAGGADRLDAAGETWMRGALGERRVETPRHTRPAVNRAE